MKRYFSLFMILFGFVFSSFASASEWEVRSGDTIWKILEEGCQVTPSQEKVKVFARAAGIQTPDHIRIGSRIDISRGCAAFPDALASSLDKASVMSQQQEETLRVLQIDLAKLEAESEKFRSDMEASLPNVTDRHQTKMSGGIAQMLSSNMEASVSQGTSAKGYHAFGDPVVSFNGWLILVVVLCLSIWFSFLWRRSTDAGELLGYGNEHRMPILRGASGDESRQRVEKGVDHTSAGLRFLGTSGGGFITLSVPFTWEMYLRFYQRVREDMNFVSFWCALPVFVSGRGYGTFECDAEGNCVYAEKIDAFKASVEGSVKLFLDGESDIALTRRIIAAVKDGLLRPSE